MVGRKALAVLAICLFVHQFLPAELVTTMKISGYTTLLHEEDTDFSLLAFGKTRLDLKSAGNKNVKGQFQLDGLISGEIRFDIPRAYMKVRFPGFRIVLGKHRLSWGEGFLFNAGDVLFEGMALAKDFSAGELREETDWLLSAYLPLGTFSFLEAVLFPHPEALIVDSSMIPESGHRVDLGGRGVTRLAGHKLEGGYIYRGSQDVHSPYVSLKGNLFTVDWYLSSSLSIPAASPSEQEIKESLALSLGFFRMVGLPHRGSLSFRLESGIRPFGRWEEVNPSPEASDYGIYLFPEAAYSPTDAISLQLRSLISPVDRSALMLTGLSWNMYQGFTMSFFFSLMVGDGDDHFGWNKQGHLALMTILEYIYGARQ